ncbi:hypothetical protein F4808DRAFT_458654 [Astrocystis sublimbata]|nr:hypothetical protein F4808DRAFT_458654 [Astrocystis sublimbata]
MFANNLSSASKKRIVVCCDGTWQNFDNGTVKAGGHTTLQVPSNVTRISRCFKRTCIDGTFQIIYYQSGVGSKSGALDRLFGGAFGIGIAENIREAYAFICANYVDGDEIVLIGFSRGAFTARSIGGMVSDLGLLTREGLEYFYPIFKDMQNWSNERYDDPFPTMPFTDKPKGLNAATTYRERLIEKGYSRARGNNGQGKLIQVMAIGVWDTVGSLGIPDFYNTHLSNKIVHGFHALALDETRGPFTPTLWERRPQEQATSDLRQVWFPGSHANIGGGYPDQGVADTTLAWMMDQLQSVGCEFRTDALERAYAATVKYYMTREKSSVLAKGARRQAKKPAIWAEKSIYEPNHPIRPWALHQIHSARGALYNILGSVSRAPGMYKKIDPKKGSALPDFLEDTNERIHPSVRVRLACQGLGVNDSGVWQCPSLLKYWRPRRVNEQFHDPVSRASVWGPVSPENEPAATAPPQEHAESSAAANDSNEANASNAENAADEATVPASSLQMLSQNPSERWVWEYVGPEGTAPPVKTLVEENLGPYEQRLLELAAGKVHVCEFAENLEPDDFMAFHLASFKKMMRRAHKRWHRLERKAKKTAHLSQGDDTAEAEAEAESAHA